MKKLTILLLLLSSIILADDWATYMHDNHRSGITTDQVNIYDLNQVWKITPPAPPMIAWDGGMPWDAWRSPSEAAAVRSTPMRDFDFVYFVTVANDYLYYGSSVDDSVHCVNAEDGIEKWIFTTDGPVRFPPTIYNNKLYFGSDDGYAYCIDANTGTQIWKYAPAVADRLIANNGKFIPMQPIRTGVAVYDGKAYFASSLVPWKKSYLCAVDAENGTEIYKVSGGTTPMGALLISPSKIYIPQGRLPPKIFNRLNGSFVGKTGGRGRGGCYALITSDPHPRFSYGWGAPHLNGYDLFEYNADSLAFVSQHLKAKRLIVHNNIAYILTGTTLMAINRKDNSVIWSVATDCSHSLILVNNVLFAGGFNKVIAYNFANGKKLKIINFNGTARGLAFSKQRLYISTDDGSIYALGEVKAPVINNSPASNITDVSANFNAELSSTGQAPTSVTLYWDTVDHGTKGKWAHSVNFGICSPGNLSTNITGLTPKTIYYYNYYAENSFSNFFAYNSEPFKTSGTPEINNTNGSSNIRATSAILNAKLVNGISANVTFYWGTTDGGTTPTNWQFSQQITNASEGKISLDISSLAKDTFYYYTTYAKNSYGSDRAPSSSCFKTKAYIPDPSTVAYWRFEDGTAGQAHSDYNDNFYQDSSTNGFDLSARSSIENNPTASSNVPFATVPKTGEQNNLSLLFGGSKTALSTDDKSGLNTYNFSSGITIELMAKFNNSKSVVTCLSKTGRPSSNNNPTLAVRCRKKNALQFVIFDGNGTIHDVRSSAGVIPTNQWVYIACVCDGSKISAYLNKKDGNGYQLVASAGGIKGSAFYGGKEKWSVGAGRWADNYPNGYVNAYIDEIRISNTALTPEQFLGTASKP